MIRFGKKEVVCPICKGKPEAVMTSASPYAGFYAAFGLHQLFSNGCVHCDNTGKQMKYRIWLKK